MSHGPIVDQLLFHSGNLRAVEISTCILHSSTLIIVQWSFIAWKITLSNYSSCQNLFIIMIHHPPSFKIHLKKTSISNHFDRSPTDLCNPTFSPLKLAILVVRSDSRLPMGNQRRSALRRAFAQTRDPGIRPCQAIKDPKGDVPLPTYPYGKSRKKPYIVGIYGL